MAVNCLCLWGDGTTYEVDTADGGRKLVTIGQRSCSCGQWQLTGIPCTHACAAIFAERRLPEDFVDGCYHKAAYEAAYSHVIHAMPGADLWPQSESGPLQPPIWRPMPGRPKKARARADDEPHDEYHVTRKGLPIRCGKCLVVGHNARSCKKPENPNRRIYPKKSSKKKGAPKGGDGQPGTSTNSGEAGTSTEAAGQSKGKRQKSQSQQATKAEGQTQPQVRRTPRQRTMTQMQGSQPSPSLSEPVQPFSKKKRNSPTKKGEGGSQPILLRRSPRKKGETAKK
ncbi:hypothetical protein CJ030_MR1G005061 [Morella rubra]|uniref:SWIM-type domain-containing protein n=1 Tax=Morella rubra TaxID=262757 RepID=A0A6A1WNF6_9ROSI|nr:hypothetical protein CJ030_MR1G005061 [Morella rubra]